MSQDLVNSFRSSVSRLQEFRTLLSNVEESAWTLEFLDKNERHLHDLWNDHEQLEEQISQVEHGELDITTDEMCGAEREYSDIKAIFESHKITKMRSIDNTETAAQSSSNIVHAAVIDSSAGEKYDLKSSVVSPAATVIHSHSTPNNANNVQPTIIPSSTGNTYDHPPSASVNSKTYPTASYLTSHSLPQSVPNTFSFNTSHPNGYFSQSGSNGNFSQTQPMNHTTYQPQTNTNYGNSHIYSIPPYQSYGLQQSSFRAPSFVPPSTYDAFTNQSFIAQQPWAPAPLHAPPLPFAPQQYLMAPQMYAPMPTFAQPSLNYAAPSSTAANMVQTNIEPTINRNQPFSEPHIELGAYHGMKLAPIELPKFSGEYTEWEAFHDLFTSMVHNNPHIPNVQKMHRLKASVCGDAANLIKHISCTDNNYAVAWDKLRNRYQNERIIITNHIDNIVKLPKMNSSSINEIKYIIDRSEDSIEAFRKLGQPVDNWSVWLVYHLVQKLDSASRCLWEQTLGKSPLLPTYNQLSEFLDERFRVLESLARAEAGSSCQNQLENKQSFKSTKAHVVSSSDTCEFCNGQHRILDCNTFKEEDIDERRSFANKKRLCYRCLQTKCFYRKCKNKPGCSVCSSRHNTLLHKDRPIEDEVEKTHAHFSKISPRHENSSLSANKKPTTTYPNNCVLLATAMLRIHLNNKEIIVRALLDQGSESSFITNAIVTKFGIPVKKSNTIISGISSTSAGMSTKSTELHVSSTAKPIHRFKINALVIDNITGYLPSKFIQCSAWENTSHLQLADPKFYDPKPIDMLLGADVYAEIIENGVIRGPKGTGTAQKTKIGWIISGHLNANEVDCQGQSTSTPKSLNARLTTDECLEKFWKLEEICSRKLPSTDELQCEQHFNDTHKRSPDGRFIVKLPFKNFAELGNSRKMAEIRLLQMEKKFARNQPFFQQYKMFINEYIEMGHMKKLNLIDKQRSISECFYLPHHAVLKAESTTTKLRVVFDGSCQTSNKLSLNDKLFVGPTLQDDLVSILMRWRCYQFAYTADITKMYRMIWMDENDANYQRILWREKPNSHMEEFKLTTVTYGTSAAAYLAIRSLRKLAECADPKFSAAADIILRDFYVDDCISGANDIETALEQQKLLRELLQTGGFELRKWSSNHSAILENVPDNHRESKLPLEFSINEPVKTLGIRWNPATDTFGFKVSLPPSTPRTTKRKLLSEVSKLFDPLGWLAPIIIQCKMIYQQLWIAQIKWDDHLPTDLEAAWQTQRRQLHEINLVQIPRWLGKSHITNSTEIHGFCDASSLGYGAAVYTRIQNDNGAHIVRLIAAKSKVAPVNTVSIPRLELCGAVMLKRLIDKVKDAMFAVNNPTYAWTDSQIVLYWIRGQPRERQVFVANRITEIHDTLSSTNWRHIPSEMNPADCISRGMATQDLLRHDLWWNGPKFLQSKNKWPMSAIEISSDANLEERKVQVFTLNTTNYSDFLSNCSSLIHLQRVTAYGFRFIHNARSRNRELRKIGHLRPAELHNALVFWIKAAQFAHFPDEYNRLMTSNEIPSRSSLLSLRPYIDKEGILRVGGRLKNAMINFNEKHPIIIPKNHKLTDLIIQDAHKRTMHGGPQLTLSLINRKFWIMESKNQVKRVIHRCITCFKSSPKACQQLMGQLPANRVNPGRPFQTCGIDFAGPIQTRISKGRGCRAYKSYIAVIVCFATKAVHLELVSDLTAAALLAALRRFVARRGFRATMYSDNATNFRRAAKDLGKNLTLAIRQASEEVASLLANDGIAWHFIPPGSPYFGGLWEAGVRSVKHHLVRVIGCHTLTYEEMTTVLHQIEAALNSRPLTPLSTNANDLQALTPGHFLIGAALTTFPEPNIADTTLASRWNLLQKMFQSFWKKWQLEYLNILQQRTKWRSTDQNVIVGQLVIIKDDQLPPTKWSLGRILETHPGADGLVRVATVKSATITKKYPVVKLCLLPTDDNLSISVTTREDV